MAVCHFYDRFVTQTHCDYVSFFFSYRRTSHDRFETRNHSSLNLTVVLPRRLRLFIKPDDVWKIAEHTYYAHVRRVRFKHTKIINHKTAKTSLIVPYNGRPHRHLSLSHQHNMEVTLHTYTRGARNCYSSETAVQIQFRISTRQFTQYQK